MGNIQKMNINELFIEFVFTFESGKNLPPVFRGKMPLEHQAWEFINDCNTLILCLITNKLLKQKSIEKIIEKLDASVDALCNYITKKEQIMLGMYWVAILRYMNKRCLEEEQFEACSNIKKFSDLYFIAAMNNDNE
jgi:hypothetical protein